MAGARRFPRFGMALLCGVLPLLAIAVYSAAASADTKLPTYDGLQEFPTIHGPADPEDYSWEVKLPAGETLRLVDDQKAVVEYESETVAWVISAEHARDATGVAVPTTLSMPEANVLTLTVHHRDGNPAAAGTPFTYPINAGESFSVGFSTVYVNSYQEDHGPKAGCLVPYLTGYSLKADRRRLSAAGCVLGRVRGKHTRANRVIKQDVPAGETIAAGSHVSVKLG